jgi:carbamoyltransferase
MTICGLKTTHDAAVALIDDGRLVFSVECEKIDNNLRHSTFTLTMNDVAVLLQQYGYSMEDVDQFVLDGWGVGPRDNEDERRTYAAQLSVDGRTTQMLPVASYTPTTAGEDLFAGRTGTIKGVRQGYRSYTHVSGHLAGAYCTSPFAVDCESSLVLVWDGGVAPLLFRYDPAARTAHRLGPLFPLEGSLYVAFAHAFRPFSDGPLMLDIAGKAMAYVALGQDVPVVRKALHAIGGDLTRQMAPGEPSTRVVKAITQEFVQRSRAYAAAHAVPDVDMLASFQAYLEDELLGALARRVEGTEDHRPNLCFAGGCALNIKWNAALRRSGLFREVWVPPFPNDAGSALGTACCEMIRGGGRHQLDWNVYAGPALRPSDTSHPMWSRRQCTVAGLARVIFETREPIVFLTGAAELGPRALGHRSILAPAEEPGMKQFLNDLKGREHYRPVAPICLEEPAPEIFDPGSPDPYMLFEHTLRPSWAARIPAIRHLDGTARLQTVNREQDPLMHELLTCYRELSGLPVLCNTSANLPGRGFFPDVGSAMAWGKVNYIWSEGVLYSRNSFAPA